MTKKIEKINLEPDGFSTFETWDFKIITNKQIDIGCTFKWTRRLHVVSSYSFLLLAPLNQQNEDGGKCRLRLSCLWSTDRQTDRLTCTTWRLQQVSHCWRHKWGWNSLAHEVQTDRLTCTTWRLLQFYHCWRHMWGWGSLAQEVQTVKQTDSPVPLEGCSRFTIVGDTSEVEAFLLMRYRQTDRHRERERQTDSPVSLEGCSWFTTVGNTGEVETLLLMRYRQTDRLTCTTWRLQQVYHCWRHRRGWGSPAREVQTDKQTDSPVPLEGCSIVIDTGEVEALLFVKTDRQIDKQTDTQTHLYHLKVAAGLPLLEIQVRLKLSCSWGTDRQTDSPVPLEGCSRFTIVGDTGEVEALLLVRYRQTNKQTHLYHLKVAALL